MKHVNIYSIIRWDFIALAAIRVCNFFLFRQLSLSSISILVSFIKSPPGQVLPKGDWICSAGPFAGGLKEAFAFVGKGYFAFSSFLGPLIKYSAVRMVWIGSSFSATRTAI